MPRGQNRPPTRRFSIARPDVAHRVACRDLRHEDQRHAPDDGRDQGQPEGAPRNPGTARGRQHPDISNDRNRERCHEQRRRDGGRVPCNGEERAANQHRGCGKPRDGYFACFTLGHCASALAIVFVLSWSNIAFAFASENRNVLPSCTVNSCGSDASFIPIATAVAHRPS
jgi:hypothetical protein